VSGSRAEMAIKLQTVARQRAAQVHYVACCRSALKLQVAYRRQRIGVIMREVFLSLAMLKGGNIFIKYSQHGPPHDRKVWLTVHESAYTENKRDAGGAVISVLEKKVVEWVLRWADPEKATKGVLKEDTLIKLDEITAVSDGITSDVVKHQEKSVLQSLRMFKGGRSGIKSLDRECCFTILARTGLLDQQLAKDQAKARDSLDLQAPNKLIKTSWLNAVRLLTTLRTTGLARIEDRTRILAFVAPTPKKAKRKSLLNSLFGSGKLTPPAEPKLSVSARDPKLSVSARDPKLSLSAEPKLSLSAEPKPARTSADDNDDEVGRGRQFSDQI